MESFPDMTINGTKVVQATGIEDPGRVSGAGTQRPDPEVPERARRRTFTGKYKLEVLAAYDAAPDGEKGAVLRVRACIPATLWTGAGPRRRRAGRSGDARGRKWRDAGRSDRPLGGREAAIGAGAGQGPLRGGGAGKTARALGDALRERGHRAEVDAVTDTAIADLATAGVRAACEAVGAAQAGYYRRHGKARSRRPAPIPHQQRRQRGH